MATPPLGGEAEAALHSRQTFVISAGEADRKQKHGHLTACSPSQVRRMNDDTNDKRKDGITMTITAEELANLSDALRGGQQCDEDGVMCIVSRQACHEAADQLERILPGQLAHVDEVEKLRAALERTAFVLSVMPDIALRVGLGGSKEWDEIAGGVDLFGALDKARTALGDSYE